MFHGSGTILQVTAKMGKTCFVRASTVLGACKNMITESSIHWQVAITPKLSFIPLR